MSTGLTIFFVFGMIMFFVIFGFAMMMMFGTKTRSKMLARQVKSLKGATDLSKEDIEQMLTNLSSASIKSKKKILDENEDTLKDIKDAETRINKDAIRETASAIKEGFVGEQVYCKHCGKQIDKDSKYCKYCGGEL